MAMPNGKRGDRRQPPLAHKRNPGVTAASRLLYAPVGGVVIV